MEKKILMFLFPLLAASCTTFQKSSSKTRENSESSSNTDNKSKEKTISKQNRNSESKTDVKSNNSEKNADKNVSFTSESLSNDSFIISKLNELKNRNNKILVSGGSKEVQTVRLQNALLRSFKKWKGTKYLFGGDSSNGIDCSALTRRVYREVFSHELPRVTTEQIKTGRHISIRELKPGDILFFRPEDRTNHTAVYVGNSLFINASSSKGVILSSLESTYWRKYFRHGVRVENINANI